MRVLEERKRSPSAKSYTVKLLNGGIDAIGAKIQEEAGEIIEAARDSAPGENGHVVHEAADLFYHACVLLVARDIPFSAVEDELRRRFGTSGLEEKASRK